MMDNQLQLKEVKKMTDNQFYELMKKLDEVLFWIKCIDTNTDR